MNLKTLEKAKRPATADEKETLSKYVGWGGIAEAFDENNSAWANEYQQLKSLLTPQEYSSARASTLDAFYTSPTVINSIYEALENFGFEGGNILEPSCGVGNFFGCMPEDMRKESDLYGVEIDSISGRIAQKIYPDADIVIQGFEKNEFQNGCFDVVVGKRYLQQCNKHKSLPCDRPSINTPEEIAFSIYAKGKYWKQNFEYYMNREYAYNRDKVKCKCCRRFFSRTVIGHCHHVDNKLPLEKINKVQNLAWVCMECHYMIHNSPIINVDVKTEQKILKYRQKLKK